MSASPIKRVIKEPSLILRWVLYKFFKWLPDEPYLKIEYFIRMKKRLNLKNPQTFNEKLQWLKLYDRKPLYTQLADKYEVRKYIAETIGEEYLVPLLGVWDRFDDIDFDALPNQFVLKCTHDSGGIVICKDKDETDDTVVQPDILVICDHSKLTSGRCIGAPDLAIEILLPSTMQHDRLVKLLVYERAGVREYWIVDAENKSVTVYLLENGRFCIKDYGDATAIPVHVLEGCIIDLTKVFEK